MLELLPEPVVSRSRDAAYVEGGACRRLGGPHVPTGPTAQAMRGCAVARNVDGPARRQERETGGHGDGQAYDQADDAEQNREEKRATNRGDAATTGQASTRHA